MTFTASTAQPTFWSNSDFHCRAFYNEDIYTVCPPEEDDGSDESEAHTSKRGHRKSTRKTLPNVIDSPWIFTNICVYVHVCVYIVYVRLLGGEIVLE